MFSKLSSTNPTFQEHHNLLLSYLLKAILSSHRDPISNSNHNHRNHRNHRNLPSLTPQRFLPRAPATPANDPIATAMTMSISFWTVPTPSMLPNHTNKLGGEAETSPPAVVDMIMATG